MLFLICLKEPSALFRMQNIIMYFCVLLGTRAFRVYLDDFFLMPALLIKFEFYLFFFQSVNKWNGARTQ